MNNTTTSKKLLVLFFFMISFIGKSQVAGTHFTVTLANVTSTSNTMEFDIMLTIDGTGDAAAGVKLSAMSVGVNYNTAIVNGGTLSCAYIGGKSAQISGLINPVSPSTVTAGHIRITGSPLTIDNSFDVVNGTYTFGRYRLTNTANWTSNSDAQLWLQPNNIGRTNTAVNAFPYGVSAGASYSYSTTAPAGSPGVSLGYTQAAPLTAMLNVSAQDCATVGSPVVTDVNCFGGTNGAATITMSALTPSVSAISYTVNGGASQNATLVSGAFTISGLSVGSYTVVISNAGCPDVTVPFTVAGPTTPLTNVTNQSACDTFTWSVTGLTYTSSGTYTGTSTNLNGCTVNETLNLTITPSTSNTTTASACDTYTWSVNGATYTASGTYTSVVGCHTETLNLTITPSTSNTTTASACDTYTWSVNGATYTASGTYTSVVGCHTETLNLTITPSTSNTTTASACDTYTWSVNGATYSASGTYTSVVGCHTETLNLTITPSTSNTTTASACDTYTWSVNGSTYTASGTYTSVVGCHTETLNLTITPSTSNTTTASACDTYTWSVNGATYTASGTYTSVVGCHTETLNLTITPSTSNTTTASACDTYTWSVNGSTYTASGTYTSVVGCHTETLNLTITPSTSNTTTASACDTYTWSVNGSTYTASGTYTSVVGCHTETLNLTITPSTSNTTTASACDTYTWSVNGATYTASGTYTSVVGCHTETLNLTITPSTSNTTTASACDTYTWSVNGATYTASGTYTSVVGCHTETLNLTITPSTSNTTTASACDTYTWSVNGSAYTASGTYTSVVGCHTETLNLTINSAATPTGASTQTISVTDLNDATLEDLIVNPSNVIWYASLADAQNQVSPLAITTVLTNGATYYAVNVSSGCPSVPFAVTVTVALGVNGFDEANFRVYPNPTYGMVNIAYTENISSVVLINMLGQIVLEEQTNSNQVSIDLSSLPSATYFVKVTANGKVKVIKVVKRE